MPFANLAQGLDIPASVDPFRLDDTLIEAYRAGQPEALERVYRAFKQPLRNFVLRGFSFRSGQRDLHFRGVFAEHDLEDIVQETFRRAFGERARQAYDGVRPFKNYLFTIARNAVINDLMHKSRQIPVGEALVRDAPSEDLSPLEAWVLAHRADFEPEDHASSDRQVENLEVYALVAAFKEALGKDEARFFELRFLAHLSQEHTAQQLGWNRARVRKLESKLRRAFLCHVRGTGYLEQRAEARVVRRAEDPKAARATFERARCIWRARHIDDSNEFLVEAA